MVPGGGPDPEKPPGLRPTTVRASAPVPLFRKFGEPQLLLDKKETLWHQPMRTPSTGLLAKAGEGDPLFTPSGERKFGERSPGGGKKSPPTHVLKAGPAKKSTRPKKPHSSNDLHFLNRDRVSLHEVKTRLSHNLRRLENQGLASRSDNYQNLLNAIAADIVNQRQHRISRKMELQRLLVTAKQLEDKEGFYKEQLQSYQTYLKTCLSNIAARNNWSMWGITLLTAHRKSCPGAARQFRLFDLMVSMAENPCLHSHVEGQISSWGTA
ncbi:Ras GTPase-activating-like protein IQGAP2 [Chionoecetes opilio]|uniref:Ras GTPase-activating-like protein IQGAP2 n=1 Tax=Chionoecetes opilio TaxID=41210 RepID=A0A8J4Y2D6_CHIOP|nr:Ras GTPase-activating-like protein IQGAP2 [Chionoecetes opilio]